MLPRAAGERPSSEHAVSSGGGGAIDGALGTAAHLRPLRPRAPTAAQAPPVLAAPTVVIGIASAPRNQQHRDWIRATWFTLPNVRSRARRADSRTRSGPDPDAVYARFMIGRRTPAGAAHPAALNASLEDEQARHGDVLLLEAREAHPPGLKMVAFFRWCVAAFDAPGGAFARPAAGRLAGARYCVKTDDDTYVHTVRLALNLRSLWERSAAVRPADAAAKGIVLDSEGGPLLYLGSTLWASYIEETFEVCGIGMGPNMAASAARAEHCAQRHSVGPFPYVAGTLEVLSLPLARWIVAQPAVAAFEARAAARGPHAPHRWSKGEDTVLGMWVHSHPGPVTALHWGWDKVHDLCFLCKDTAQLWKPITTQSVVVHIKGHQANRANYEAVHANFSRVCDEACRRAVLPLEVPSLADLCGRNRAIRQSYSKCALLRR